MRRPGNTREATVQRGLRLEYFTLGWNFIEAAVALIAGALAGSIALVGFGLDSVIEMSSGAVLLWRLKLDRREEDRERNERRALRWVGVSFMALAAYVTYGAIKELVTRDMPQKTWPGIVLAAVSLIVMLILARAKRQVARDMDSGAMHADSRQTDFCAYLSAIVLLGLFLNQALGWWWADAAAALVMVPFIVNEAVEALKGKRCGCE